MDPAIIHLKIFITYESPDEPTRIIIREASGPGGVISGGTVQVSTSSGVGKYASRCVHSDLFPIHELVAMRTAQCFCFRCEQFRGFWPADIGRGLLHNKGLVWIFSGAPGCAVNDDDAKVHISEHCRELIDCWDGRDAGPFHQGIWKSSWGIHWYRESYVLGFEFSSLVSP